MRLATARHAGSRRRRAYRSERGRDRACDVRGRGGGFCRHAPRFVQAGTVVVHWGEPLDPVVNGEAFAIRLGGKVGHGAPGQYSVIAGRVALDPSGGNTLLVAREHEHSSRFARRNLAAVAQPLQVSARISPKRSSAVSIAA